MAISDRLAEVRRKAGKTQQEFADAVGVSKNTQMRYEKGHRHPDTEYLERVSKGFAVDFNWLISGEPTRHMFELENISELTLEELEKLRAKFTLTFGMSLPDFDLFMSYLQLYGDQARLNLNEQSILNAYRSTDSLGRRALEGVAAVVLQRDSIENRVVAEDVWSAGPMAEAMQKALKAKRDSGG